MDENALASIEQLLREERLRRILPANPIPQEIISDDEPTPDQEEGDTQVQPTIPQTEQQAQISRAVGNALTRLQRFSEAAPYLRVAQALEKTPAVRKAITAELSQIRAMLQRELQNQAHQPILHEELEQNRLVRPRLVARGTSLPKPSAGLATKKEAQP